MPCGYLIAFLIQSLEAFWLVHTVSHILCLLIGVNWFLVEFVNEIESDLKTLNEEALHEVQNAQRNRKAITTNLKDIIIFHTSVKQLSSCS